MVFPLPGLPIKNKLGIRFSSKFHELYKFQFKASLVFDVGCFKGVYDFIGC